MRPDKRKKNRARYGDKSEANSSQEKKTEEHADISVCESGIKEKTEQVDVSKSVPKKETAEKAKIDAPPILNLRRETDELKETKKFSKRQIFSNWEKYDEPIDPVDENEIHDDFGLLIQRNFSGDEHFKFKFQQQWEKKSFNINQDLFTLNLERLSSGLSCIPYYKRLNLPVELFSEEDLQLMQDDVKAKKRDYENILKGEPNEPVTASLLGKLKECLDNKVVKETKFQGTSGTENSKESEEPALQSNEASTLEGYAFPNETVWDIDPCPKKTGMVKSTESSVQINVEKIFQNESKMEIKEEIKVNKEMEEKVEVATFDQLERMEVEKEQRVRRPSNRRREARRSFNKIEQSNDFSVNTAEVKPSANENLAKEEIITGGEAEMIPELESPQEIKCALPKREFTVETPVFKVNASDLPAPAKQPVIQVNSKKNVIEEDDELDSLLSLKEPSLPLFNLSHKSEEDEHEMEGLSNNISSIVIHEKKENLEEWLDSMLDD